MKTVKVFNNNAISTVMLDGREAILLGKGIGFHKRPGDTVDEEKIEKVYYVQNEMQTKFLQMLQDVRPDVLNAAERINEIAERAGFYMSSQATISLTDHISFAIERQEQHLELPNLLLGETQLLYQKEYELGRQALRIIRDCCGVALPEDEAGYIALHFASISVDSGTTYYILKFVKGMLEIIKQTYGVELDPDSTDTMRLTTHLKFLAQRMQQNRIWRDDEDDFLYQYLLSRDPRHELYLERLDQFIQKEKAFTFGKQEKSYLLIHLTKILKIDE